MVACLSSSTRGNRTRLVTIHGKRSKSAISGGNPAMAAACFYSPSPRTSKGEPCKSRLATGSDDGSLLLETDSASAPQGNYLRTRPELVQIVRPCLHHYPPLGQMCRPIIGTPIWIA